jgi:Tol biopolymer transport system component
MLLLSTVSVQAILTQSTPRQVTNTTSGKNENASTNRNGKLFVFTSNTQHEGNAGPQNGNCQLPPEVTDTAPFQFDFDCSGNNFAVVGVDPPQPLCLNCDLDNGTAGNLFIWRQKRMRGGFPANSIEQITFTAAGGIKGNANPNISQNGQWIVWESDQEQAGTGVSCGNCSNADGNREIFLYAVRDGTMTQITTTTASGDSANRNPGIDDRGNQIIFDSTRDFAGPSCAQLDGSPCDNADGNSEVMLYVRQEGRFIQITDTSGNGADANIRPRISPEGKFAAFQSTRDQTSAGLGCAKPDGSPCSVSDNNGEIYLVDLTVGTFTQVTDSPNQGPCSGTNPNERVELSRKGKFLSFQSKCEASLNPTGCGDCGGNDEVFVYEHPQRRLRQATVSDSGFNRVPRIAGGGFWVVFESNRNYKNLNPGHSKVLYLIRRDRFAQVVEDALGPLQDIRTKLVSINLAGGFNSSTEGFGVSNSGRFVSFDNSKGVGNHEIWYLDRNR